MISVRVSEKHSQVTNLEFNSTVTLAFPPICKHYWIIEEAKGKYSKGYCIHCGTSQLFSNEPVSVSPMNFNDRLIRDEFSAFEKRLKTNCYDLLGDSR